MEKVLDIEKLTTQCYVETEVQVSQEMVPTDTPVCRCMRAEVIPR